jgi:hypothetical protein
MLGVDEFSWMLMGISWHFMRHFHGKSQRFGAPSFPGGSRRVAGPAGRSQREGIDLYDEMKKFYAWILSDFFSPAWVSHFSEMLVAGGFFCPSECETKWIVLRVNLQNTICLFNIAMEIHHAINGKTHYFYGHLYHGYVK